MNDPLTPTENRIIERFRDSVRGPRRNGLFALWLVVRMCGGVLPPSPLTQRGHRRRLEQLKRRLSSLSLQQPLRKALTQGIDRMREGTAAEATRTLGSLVEPVCETLGPDTGRSIAMALLVAESCCQSAEKP